MSLKHIEALITRAPGNREIDFVCSTETVDGHGEIVKLNWDLTRYNKNPVVLWAHDTRALPIGTASNVRIEGGKLKARIRFASAATNPQAEQVYQGVLEGTIKAVSVGFRAGTVTREVHDGVERYVLDNNELFEISVVPVGSNPDALQGKSLITQALDRSAVPPAERAGLGLARAATAFAFSKKPPETKAKDAASEFVEIRAKARAQISTAERAKEANARRAKDDAARGVGLARAAYNHATKGA